MKAQKRRRMASRALALCALLAAVTLGGAQAQLMSLSQDWTGQLFPVTYRAEYVESASGQAVVLTGVPVSLQSTRAVVYAPGGSLTLSLDDVRLTCLDPATRAVNQSRAGLLTVLLELPLMFSIAGMLMLSVALRGRPTRQMRPVSRADDRGRPPLRAA